MNIVLYPKIEELGYSIAKTEKDTWTIYSNRKEAVAGIFTQREANLVCYGILSGIFGHKISPKFLPVIEAKWDFQTQDIELEPVTNKR